MVSLSSIIKGMKERGMNNSRIIDELKNKGHSSQDIYTAIDQSGQNPASDLEPPSPNMKPMPSSIPMEELGNEPQWGNEEQEIGDNMMGPSIPDNMPQQIPQRHNVEQIEEIAEAIVDERIQEFSSNIGDINMWKERVNSEISAIKQEVIRLRNHVENLQTTMIGKVEGYNKSIQSMSIEMKALSSVMEKIMQPLTMNVKELSRITETFKKIK
mgnify:CR=1 FL=1